jgi:type III restriction enzyme
MKLQFDSTLEYQRDAVEAVTGLFIGQTPMNSNFTVTTWSNQKEFFESSTGVANRLELDEDDILHNLQQVQLRNGIAPTPVLKKGAFDFDIEMETGTGKTYVYLRTVFELYKRYGFTKFIIVVPGIAIKEGTDKTLSITREHFEGLYNNVVYDSFVYDSQKLEQVRSFTVSDTIQILVINIDAFRKSFENPDMEGKSNIIHRPNDKLNGSRPIEIIAETNPIVIIDEPQSVDSTPKAKQAIKTLNPLCTLRYSATHVEKHNLVYKLDAVDAFRMNLVKQIEVDSFETADAHNNAYLKLVSVDNAKPPITARIELDADVKGTVTRKIVKVRQGDDLSEKKLGNRAMYENYIVNDIYCEKENEYVDFTQNDVILYKDKPVGEIDDVSIKDQQIRKTIEEHLEKELRFRQNHLDVKVLSLFFLDRVANYREYRQSDNGTTYMELGRYGRLFEKNYRELISRPKYKPLWNGRTLEEVIADIPHIHDGYFSIDKKGVMKDTDGTTQSDDSTYNTIMKDKEALLSFDDGTHEGKCPQKLRFIFSHSALREGWDNPNVFQICTLNETRSEVKKRQEIGRGLRLCVNQSGERIHNTSVNTLTVMANESYQSFAEKLQKEYETDEGIRFGVLETHSFANILVKAADGTDTYLGHQASEALFNHFVEKRYIDAGGNVLDTLRTAIKTQSVDIPDAYAEVRDAVISVAAKACGSLNIKPAGNRMPVKLNKAVYLSPDFKQLWDNIKYKATYNVVFDNTALITKCITALHDTLSVEAEKLIFTKARAEVNESGIETHETERRQVRAAYYTKQLPDIVSYLQNETDLTRKSIVEILVRSDTLDLFRKNPQKYMEESAKVLQKQMQSMLVDGIKYTRIGDDSYYAQELFETE